MIRALTSALVLLGAAAWVQAAPGDAALERLKGYIEVDTTNPPGNESRGVAFLARILEAHGIAYETAESAPGRGNLWARLPGGEEPALLLLHHIDVVPASPDSWKTDPLRGVERNGFIHGRGTLDTKGLGIMHLEAFLALHRSGAPLRRDVVFMATADEEAGGAYGVGWLVENRPDLFRDVGFVLNEGGMSLERGEKVEVSIEVAEKVPIWLRLSARGVAGHGSVPLQGSAPVRLVAALQRIQEKPFEPRILSPVRAVFEAAAVSADEPWASRFRDIDRAIADPAFLERLHAQRPMLHALTRNTCSLTVLSGSSKVNVVPPRAHAELDCRMLPDQDADAFVAALRERIADDGIESEPLVAFSAASSSPDTDLFRLLERITRAYFPQAIVFPGVATGFTDSHFFRDLGITSYGYLPAAIPEGDTTGAHGDDERISVEEFHRGVQAMTEIVTRFATAHATEPAAVAP
jgi:acetylornithine deacetylase/succinyl-diaminopimelate desuccinylase-like protein